MYAGDVHEGIIRIFLKAKKAAENLIIGGSGMSIMRTDDRKTTSFGALLKMPRQRKFGLTTGGARPCADIFFNDLPGQLSRREGVRKKLIFLLPRSPESSQNRWKSGLTGPRPDITPGGSVQNILKKVKKRLVSPLKPR
jgi:hypothetical protein